MREQNDGGRNREAYDFVSKLYGNVPVLDPAARARPITFGAARDW